MKAVRLRNQEDLAVQNVDDPVPAAGEIVLRIDSAHICGTDLRMYRHGHKGRDASAYLTLGHEVAGEIAALGEGVEGYTVGHPAVVAPNYGCGVCDLCVSGQTHLCRRSEALGVTRNGGFAEYMLIPAQAVAQGNVTELEGGASLAEAALAEPFSCVINAFERSHNSVGESVLVIGAGPIGLMHAMLHKSAGAGTVMITDINGERLAAAKEIDPDFTIIDGDLEELVREQTRGRGADVVITAAPVPSIQQAALRVAAINGRVVFFGGLPKDKQEVTLNTNTIHYNQLIVTGTTRQSLKQFREAVAMIESGRVNLKPLITERFDLDHAVAAFEQALQGRGLRTGFSIGG